MTTDEERSLVEALARVGVKVDSVYDLVNTKRSYEAAIPVLIEHLAKWQDRSVLEGIVRALTVRKARGVAARPLIELFESLPASEMVLKWTIGNALSVVADDSILDDLIRLLRNKEHGKAREMLAVALGHSRKQDATTVLIELLDDNELVGHAAIALGKQKATEARSKLEQLLNHSVPWVRLEVRRAISKIDGKR